MYLILRDPGDVPRFSRTAVVASSGAAGGGSMLGSNPSSIIPTQPRPDHIVLFPPVVSSRRHWHHDGGWCTGVHPNCATKDVCIVPMRHARLRPRRAVAGVAGDPAAAAAGLWDPQRLTRMLTQLADAGHPPESEWLAMFLAASAACAASTTPQQVAELLHAATALGLFEPGMRGTQAGDLTAAQWVDTLLTGCRHELSRTPASDLVALCEALYTSGHTPLDSSFLPAALRQIKPEELQPEGCARAILLAAVLRSNQASLQGIQVSHQAEGVAEEQQQQPTGPSLVDGDWLDAMTQRMLDCDMEGLDTEAISDVAYCLATQHRHIPPAAWVVALEEAALDPQLPPPVAASVAISLASFKALPDLLVAKSAWLQTYVGLRDMPPELVLDLLWAGASWEIGKSGTDSQRFDFRPPERWWEEWFQATARLLADIPPQATLKLVWGLAYCQILPPSQWLGELLRTADLQLRALRFTPLELLYLSRSADRLYATLTVATTGLDASRGQRPGSSVPDPAAWIGSPPYEPPLALAALIANAVAQMGRASLPAGARRLNTAYPPYALPDRTEDVQALAEQQELEEMERERQRLEALQQQMSTSSH